MFTLLDERLQQELLAFCKTEEENKQPKPFKLTLAAELLRQITRREREITGLLTNEQTGDIFVRFSLTKEV